MVYVINVVCVKLQIKIRKYDSKFLIRFEIILRFGFNIQARNVDY